VIIRNSKEPRIILENLPEHKTENKKHSIFSFFSFSHPLKTMAQQYSVYPLKYAPPQQQQQPQPQQQYAQESFNQPQEIPNFKPPQQWNDDPITVELKQSHSFNNPGRWYFGGKYTNDDAPFFCWADQAELRPPHRVFGNYPTDLMCRYCSKESSSYYGRWFWASQSVPSIIIWMNEDGSAPDEKLNIKPWEQAEKKAPTPAVNNNSTSSSMEWTPTTAPVPAPKKYNNFGAQGKKPSARGGRGRGRGR
jgi:hypothetical protein